MYKDQKEWFRTTQDELTSPYIIHLKVDSFERFVKARGYDEYAENRSWIILPSIMHLNEKIISKTTGFSPKVDDLITVI